MGSSALADVFCRGCGGRLTRMGVGLCDPCWDSLPLGIVWRIVNQVGPGRLRAVAEAIGWLDDQAVPSEAVSRPPAPICRRPSLRLVR